MNKNFLVIAALLIAVSTAAGFGMATNVDCGWGSHASCEENEVQRAVDNLDDDIDDLEHKNWHQDQSINGLSYWNVGQDEKLESQEEYIASREAAWTADAVGGGIGTSRLGSLLTGNNEYFTSIDKPFLTVLDERFCSSEEYHALDYRVSMMEQFLIEKLGYNPADPELELRGAQRLGELGSTKCYEGGLCLRSVN